MNVEFFIKHEKFISLAANGCAVVAAIFGALTFVVGLNPLAFALAAFIGLLFSLGALAAKNKRVVQLEKQTLSLAERYFSLSTAAYNSSLQDRQPTFAELGYLVASLTAARKQAGLDTDEVDALLDKILLAETGSKK